MECEQSRYRSIRTKGSQGQQSLFSSLFEKLQYLQCLHSPDIAKEASELVDNEQRKQSSLKLKTQFMGFILPFLTISSIFIDQCFDYCFSLYSFSLFY
jgi:hypothetical protein